MKLKKYQIDESARPNWDFIIIMALLVTLMVIEGFYPIFEKLLSIDHLVVSHKILLGFTATQTNKVGLIENILLISIFCLGFLNTVLYTKSKYFKPIPFPTKNLQRITINKKELKHENQY